MRSLQPKISQRQNVQCWTSNPFRGWSERQTSLCVGGRFHSRATPCLNRSGQTPSAMSCCAETRIGFKPPDDNSCGLLGKSVVALALSGWENRLLRYCQALDSFENRQPYLDLSTSLVQVLVPLREAAGGSAPTSDVIMAEPRIEAALLWRRCRMVWPRMEVYAIDHSCRPCARGHEGAWRPGGAFESGAVSSLLLGGLRRRLVALRWIIERVRERIPVRKDRPMPWRCGCAGRSGGAVRRS